MQLSTFTIGNETFALPALMVEEFFRTMPVTKVFGADHRIDGMVNIRGRTAVVLNLRACFDLPPRASNETSEMILLENSSGLVSEAVDIGLYAFEEPLVLSVDTINQIYNLESEEIHPAPAHIRQPFVEGVVEAKDAYLIIISIQKLVAELLH